MAWSTCQHCAKRVNGWSAMNTHQRQEHPSEYRIAEAQKQLTWAEERLAGHIRDKLEYETLDAVLAQALPVLVTDILTRERDKRQVWMYLKGEWLVIPFDEQIAEDTEWLTKHKATLAALQVTA